MIALLTGILRTIDNGTVILDVQGVGYLVGVTSRTQNLLGPVGSTATLHIITQVREDAITLYGFAQNDEREAFNKLTTVQGVGAKMALSLLSSLPPEQLWRAIIADDKKSLTAADGVGPKLAARLTTELKDYAGKQIFPGNMPHNKNNKVVNIVATAPMPMDVTQEAISALIHLGYNPSDAARAISIAANQNEGADLQSLIKLGLREVSNI